MAIIESDNAYCRYTAKRHMGKFYFSIQMLHVNPMERGRGFGNQLAVAVAEKIKEKANGLPIIIKAMPVSVGGLKLLEKIGALTSAELKLNYYGESLESEANVS